MRSFLAVLLFFVSGSLWANVGIPMLAVAWPVYWIALAPVILLEAIVAMKIIQLGWKQALGYAAFANGLSTMVGVPVTWLLLLLLEYLAAMGLSAVDINGDIVDILLFPFMAAWLPPVENNGYVVAAFTVLAVAFCAMSIYVEAEALTRWGDGVTADTAYRWSMVSNVLSYTCITVGFILLNSISMK